MNIAIDLDGTILEFDWDLWERYRQKYFGKPIKGARLALKKLRQRGHRIIIHTCRTNNVLNSDHKLIDLHNNVARVLKHHKIPYDEIWIGQGKPIAHVYVDDRGLNFSDWNNVMMVIERFGKDSNPGRQFLEEE